MNEDEERPGDRERRRATVLQALGRIAALIAAIITLLRRWLDS
ncbi:hypothetical protein [Amycolatopsis australiensis]|uniref:Uncharacterized protein n=1 Tax=Amycolatopsis australiensis TaxID=546364 RepID=A0A1K1T6A1_9PSEU|nr:hypothetical protein [Amycolatopsis australiensis]SFW92123.1 hypothetical protein SAMN04489730_8400 [Amycolatopsis australiensis]